MSYRAPRGTALTLLCWLCLTGMGMAADQTTILGGKVMSPVTRAVPLPFNAVVDEALVSPGDTVQEGQPLLRYHLQEEAGRQLQKEITFGAGTEGERSQMLNVERTLAETEAQRNKARQLVASGLGSPQALARLESSVASLRQNIDLLRATVQKKETSFKERLKELSGYFGSTIKEGAQLPRSLVLTAPISGHVLSVGGNLYPGALLSAGSAPISVGLMNPMLIQVQAYEAEISRIKEGDTATVNIPSLRDKAFTAKVTSIAWTSNDVVNVGTPSFYMVELIVPNPELELKPGFRALVHFGGAPAQ